MSTTAKTYSSDRKGYSFLLIMLTLLTAAVLMLLKYLLGKLEIMYPGLFEQERSVPEIIIYSLIIFFAAVYIIFALFVLRFWHRSLRCTLTDLAIVTDTGFISKNHQIMKYSSVMYINHISMPLSSINSFNFVIISALGGRLILMFLSDSDAREITEKVLEKITPTDKTEDSR